MEEVVPKAEDRTGSKLDESRESTEDVNAEGPCGGNVELGISECLLTEGLAIGEG